MTRNDHHTSSVDGAAAFERDHGAHYDDRPDMSDFTREELAQMPKRDLRRLGYRIPDDPFMGGAA